MTPRPIPLRPDASALQRETRQSLVRALAAQTLASLRGQRNVLTILRSAWDDRGAESILRAAISPTDTTDFPPTVGLASLALIAPSSAALRLFETQLHISLGQNSSVRIPNVAVPPVAAFVPELSPGPVLQATLSATTLGPTRKILILATLTEELERASPETASVVIGYILAASAAKAIDTTAFDANAGDDIRPPGLLHNVTPLTAATGGGITAIATDIGNMAAAMAAANIDPENMIIVAAPKQATTLRLLAGPQFTNEIFGTVGLPDKTIVGIARDAVASSFEGVPTIETTKGATIHVADPAAVVMSSPTTSLYQQAQVGVKLRQRGSWAVVAPGGVQAVSNVTW
jgi:hypothetical protein